MIILSNYQLKQVQAAGHDLISCKEECNNTWCSTGFFKKLGYDNNKKCIQKCLLKAYCSKYSLLHKKSCEDFIKKEFPDCFCQ